jgi:hypothetical protein
MSRLLPLVAALLATATLAVGAPAAIAATALTNQFPMPTASPGIQGWRLGASSGLRDAADAAAGPCGSATGSEVVGRKGTTAQVCGGLSFVGPAIGEITTVIGPTIISPAVVGSSIVNGSNIVIGP